MDMQKTGQLIRRLREAQGITQKALAEKLHVTDKAVSKWERSLSCPDVALLAPLAGQLGISVSELLQGELNEPAGGGNAPQGLMPHRQPRPNGTSGNFMPGAAAPSCTAAPCTAACSGTQGIFAKRASRTLQKYAFCVCSLLFFTAGVICAICDLAIFGAFTWSLYPIASLVFAWTVLSPLLQHGKKGIRGCLISLTLAIFPFFLVLAWLLQRPPLFLPVSLSMAVIGLGFLWGVYLLLHKLAKRKMLARALCALLAVFAYLAVNLSLSRLLQIPFLDGWDGLSISICLCLAVFFLRLDRKRRLPRHTSACADEAVGTP